MAGYINQFEQPLGYVQITSLGSATKLSSAGPIPQNASMITVYVEGGGVRWRDDGVVPTATVGNPVAAGQAFSYTGNLSNIQFIQQTAGAIINVNYYAGV